MGSTRRMCRVESSRAKWNLSLFVQGPPSCWLRPLLMRLVCLLSRGRFEVPVRCCANCIFFEFCQLFLLIANETSNDQSLQVIFSYLSWRNRVRGGASNVAWKFDAVRVLVVDEGSLVAVTTFHSVIDKLLPSLQKVVLLGDVLQLPSIEPGTAATTIFVC